LCPLIFLNSTLASRRYTRANLDLDPPHIYENPNLIPRIRHQESSISHVFKSHSCLDIFAYLEELDFDEQFELSLSETKSERAVESTVHNP